LHVGNDLALHIGNESRRQQQGDEHHHDFDESDERDRSNEID
jgi:hypothetical protein